MKYIKYSVEIGYKRYIFEDDVAAMDFAHTVVKHQTTDDAVTIQLIVEDEEE